MDATQPLSDFDRYSSNYAPCDLYGGDRTQFRDCQFFCINGYCWYWRPLSGSEPVAVVDGQGLLPVADVAGQVLTVFPAGCRNEVEHLHRGLLVGEMAPVADGSRNLAFNDSIASVSGMKWRSCCV